VSRGASTSQICTATRVRLTRDLVRVPTIHVIVLRKVINHLTCQVPTYLACSIELCVSVTGGKRNT
jgi:hypothetical protein